MDRASLRFHNHRRGSFLARDEDIDELVEIRARQRTFEGAYVRTALGNLGYSCLILRVFSTEFAKIGLMYTLSAILLLCISVFRLKRSEADFADVYRSARGELRNWGRPFRTGGNVVVTLGLVVGGLEIALLVLVMHLA